MSLFRHIIYLLQLQLIFKRDILKLQLEENYYSLKANLFFQFLNSILKKNLFSIKSSYFYFFSSDLYLLSVFRYYQLEFVFRMHHNRIVKNITSQKINEFIDVDNFS